MFLSDKYILASELTDSMGIHTANISIISNKLDNAGINDIVKMGACSFINTESLYLPKYLVNGIHCNTLTDISHMLPITYVCKEFNVTKKEIMKLINNPEIPEFQEVLMVGGKNLVKFSEKFVRTVKDCVIYPLSTEETQECLDSKDIDGFISVNKTKCITWYSISNRG